jgi:hypothetical protein
MTKIKPLTEADWLTSAEPYWMLRHLQQHQRISRTPGGARRLRLLVVAFCRRVEHLMEERCRKAVAVAERYADGKARKAELEAARAEVEEVERIARAKVSPARKPRKDWVPVHRAWLVANMAQRATQTYGLAHSVQVVSTAFEYAAYYEAGLGQEEMAAAQQVEKLARRALIHDIFGNPFQPTPAVENAWLVWNHGIIAKMARVIYDERALDRMPILADALEEAGCTDTEILSHCRGGAHTRGCWLIDLLTGKGHG